jgi:hypothetical protein
MAKTQRSEGDTIGRKLGDFALGDESHLRIFTGTFRQVLVGTNKRKQTRFLALVLFNS